MKKVMTILLCFSLWNCDKIDDPIPDDLGTSFSLGGNVNYIVDSDLNLQPGDTTALIDFISSRSWDTAVAPSNANKRVVVLEEFTGHECIFCPKGTREIVRLDGVYGDQLIPVAIHGGTFAVPNPPKFPMNFIVSGGHADEYISKFLPVEQYPRAVISRSTNLATSNDSWDSQISAILNDNPKVQIDLTTYFNSADSLIRANVKINWKETLSENYNLQVFVVEDHIVAPQKDLALVIKEYDHRHVLRKVVNGTFGTALKAAVAEESEEIQFIFPFKEMLQADNQKNIEVVVFVFDNDPSTNIIIQGNATKVLN